MPIYPRTGGLCLAGIVLTAIAVSGQADAQDKDKMLPLALQWRRATLMDKNEFTGENDPGQATKVWVDKALKARGDAPIVPAFRPLVIGDLVVLRTYDDVRVLSLVDQGKPNDTKAGGIHWVGTPGEGGLVTVLDRVPVGRITLTNWLNHHQQTDLAQAIVENGLSGALSYDGQRVFWVDNLAVPQPPSQMMKGKKAKLGNVDPEQDSDGLHSRLEHNVLMAIDLRTGKIAWRDGEFDAGKNDPFAHSHFLGVPSSAKEKLYVLNETNAGQLRLLVLDAATGAAKSKHNLDSVTAPNRFMDSARRQAHAAQVVADPALVVCVPHTGKVFGVEPKEHKVRWTYSYGTAMAAAGAPNQLGFWKDTAPIIHDGKVVCTTADSEEVHCVNLEDGRMLWKKRPPDGLYVAGIVGDNVLVVCKSSCRALALKNGDEAWTVDIGTPSGYGVFDKNTFLVPVKKGATSTEPQIVHVDAERGQIAGTSLLKEMPGNLALYQGQIVSESATTVAAWRR
jgi:outer membrane protein assembly factor BamB